MDEFENVETLTKKISLSDVIKHVKNSCNSVPENTIIKCFKIYSANEQPNTRPH